MAEKPELPKTEGEFFEHIDGKVIFFPLGPLSKGFVLPDQRTKGNLVLCFRLLFVLYAVLGVMAVKSDGPSFQIGVAVFVVISFKIAVAVIARKIPRYHKRQTWFAFATQQATNVPYFAMILSFPFFLFGSVMITWLIIEDLLQGKGTSFHAIATCLSVWLVVVWIIYIFKIKKRIERMRSNTSEEYP